MLKFNNILQDFLKNAFLINFLGSKKVFQDSNFDPLKAVSGHLKPT